MFFLNKRNMDITKTASYIITGCAFDVLNEMHYGLLESAYEVALKWELEQKGFKVKRQVYVPLFYKGVELEQDYRLDLLVDDRIILELKTVSTLLPEHRFQLMNYMRITQKQFGILINFGPNGVQSEKYKLDIEHNRVELIADNVIR